jgi:hypothetical protein
VDGQGAEFPAQQAKLHRIRNFISNKQPITAKPSLDPARLFTIKGATFLEIRSAKP